jgi:hypothetical protein
VTELYLNAEGQIHQTLAAQIKAFGFEGIRAGFHAFNPTKNLAILNSIHQLPFVKWHLIIHGGFMSFDTAGARPLSLVEAQNAFRFTFLELNEFLKLDPWLANQWTIEVFNEPSLQKSWTPQMAAQLWDSCYRLVREHHASIELCSPAPHNLDRKAGFQFLRSFLEHITEWDSHCRVGVHRYVPRAAGGPHEGWETRQQEQDALESLLGGKRYSVTETGISASRRRPRPFPLCWWKQDHMLDQTDQGLIILRELMYWKNRADKVVLYQLNSGPDWTDPEHHYGIRDPNEAWKGYAYLFNTISKAYKGGEE